MPMFKAKLKYHCNIIVLIVDFEFNLKLISFNSVSPGAVCSLAILLSFPRCRQPLRPQGHLSGVASHPPHHSGSRVQGWRFVHVGLQGANQDELCPRGEFLCVAEQTSFQKPPSLCFLTVLNFPVQNGAGDFIGGMKFCPMDLSKIYVASGEGRLSLQSFEGHTSTVLATTADCGHDYHNVWWGDKKTQQTNI